MSVSVRDDGPTIQIRCQLPTFPDHPPVRWQRREYNAAVLELRLLAAASVRLEGWSNQNVGTVVLTRNGPAVRLEISGPQIFVTADALGADITHVEGYHRAD